MLFTKSSKSQKSKSVPDSSLHVTDSPSLAGFKWSLSASIVSTLDAVEAPLAASSGDDKLGEDDEGTLVTPSWNGSLAPNCNLLGV